MSGDVPKHLIDMAQKWCKVCHGHGTVTREFARMAPQPFEFMTVPCEYCPTVAALLFATTTPLVDYIWAQRKINPDDPSDACYGDWCCEDERRDACVGMHEIMSQYHPEASP